MAKPITRTYRIHRRTDGRFESRNENPKDSPLGVDSNMDMAIGSAMREATLTARRERCRVVIEVKDEKGRWRQEAAIEPPR